MVQHAVEIPEDLEKENRKLHEELAGVREAFAVMADIGAHLRAGQNPQELLERILDRAVAWDDGLRAVLWLVEEDQLEPVASKNVAPCPPRPLRESLIGTTLSRRQSVLVNGRSAVAAVAGREPELSKASSLAVVPIATQRGLLGALEVWQDQGSALFDTHTLHLLEALALLIVMVVENDRLHRATVEGERLRRDIEIGSRIQQTLLVGRPPLDLQVIQVAGLTIPSFHVDGDFYDFFTHDQMLDVILGDVMGKGIPAALIGVATKDHFLRALNYLLASNPSSLPEPREILNIVNEELVKQLMGIESFVTLCYARFNLKKFELDLIDCGHTRTIHSTSRAGTFALLQGKNMPLGFSQGEIYEKISTPFTAGDVFFFYSDGVTEAKNHEGKYFGERRLAELVHAHNHLDPKGLVERVRQEITAFSRSQTFLDDLTCVAVKIQDVHATVAANHAHLEITSSLSELPRVRTFIREVCARNFDLTAIEEALNQLELAVTETISNIMIHAYQRQPNRQVRIETNLFVNRLLVRVYHRGLPFNPGPDEPAPLEAPREGQMGMSIIRQCVDRVRYYRSKHGENCVDLVKIFRQATS